MLATLLGTLLALAPTPTHRVLIVVTNTDTLRATSAPSGFGATEVVGPYDALCAAGYTVELASPKGGKVQMDPRGDPRNPSGFAKDFEPGKRFLADPKRAALLDSTRKLSEVELGAFDAVLFAGGSGAPFDFPGNADVQRTARTFFESDRLVAALGQGSSALEEVKLSNGAYLVDGRQVTGFSNKERELAGTPRSELPASLEDTLKAHGALYVAAPPFQSLALRDGNLVTAQQPQSVPRLITLLLGALAEPPQVRANKALLHRYHLEVWEQGRLQEAGKYLGPGFTSHASPLHDPAGQKTGPDLLRVLRTAFPDLTSTEEALLGDGDLVTLRWTIRGTHKGTFLGVMPTGRRIEVTGMDMLRIENGKFVEHWGGLKDQLEVILGQLKGP